jgi:hypothetical protein
MSIIDGQETYILLQDSDKGSPDWELMKESTQKPRTGDGRGYGNANGSNYKNSDERERGSGRGYRIIATVPPPILTNCSDDLRSDIINALVRMEPP